MNCHQVLSGACNAGDRCFSVGSVEGIPFTAYAAGCNIVILASTFERVQIIPGAKHGYIKISAIDCSTDTGKIAAAYENKICIYEPTPVILSEKHYSHNLDYRWVQTGSFLSLSHVITLSWNLEGTRLLTGGSYLQLWKEKIWEKNDNTNEKDVKFVIGESKSTEHDIEDDVIKWHNMWSCKTAIPIFQMAFSPDGSLFATCGRNDRLVKIWYENNRVLFPAEISENLQNSVSQDTNVNFTYIYIAHPRAVTYLSWRKTSKYMPKGSVSNMLVTSCFDNICRIWIETVVPDDGLVNLSQFDPSASHNPKFRTHRHKHRFMQRLKHMKTCFHIRRHIKNSILNNLSITFDGNNHSNLIPSLPSSSSVHDFHLYSFHVAGVTPGMHFHLAASINAETDIPLVPSIQSSDIANQSSFILHWLNNKEMQFTIEAEDILQEYTKKLFDEESPKDYENSSYNYENNHASQDIREVPKQNVTKASFKSISVDENNVEDYFSKKCSSCNTNLNLNFGSNNTSFNSLVNENSPLLQLTDSLDTKIDGLLRDWHRSPDLLFAIHPVDGSYLIWVTEWLEDYYPGSFRQTQVSFSTRIPSAFPISDAMSMSTMVSLYNTGSSPLIFREIVSGANNKGSCKVKNDISIKECVEEPKSDSEIISQAVSVGTNLICRNNSSTVSMVTKHTNGTLNLWQLTFAFQTKFTQVLSICHVKRASGHRFRVNELTCHPVLPLLLSTSHHNLHETDTDIENPSSSSRERCDNLNDHIFSQSGFCSELILWRVDAVGPLNYSGGLSELARINSPIISAFSNVAWIPTLLPSTILGGYSNSPSACFVASDGENLRVYQAVIDARTLLAELSESENLMEIKKASSVTSLYSDSSFLHNKNSKYSFYEKIKIVSQQSTARPGCIIELDAVSDAKHDWQNTQFLYVFQKQAVTDSVICHSSYHKSTMSSPVTSDSESEIDSNTELQKHPKFKEHFFIVIIEKALSGSTIHMWQIIISSKCKYFLTSQSPLYVPDNNIAQEGIKVKGLGTSQDKNINPHVDVPLVSIRSEKICTQELPLPTGIDLLHASPAAGHLSSSSIFPPCRAPYIIVTACSDSICRFWKCEPVLINKEEHEFSFFKWSKWKMFAQPEISDIEIPGEALHVSAAYSGRIACAYKHGRNSTSNEDNSDSKYINLSVGIYECESTGGSQWILEDTINLRNIFLPCNSGMDHGIDLSYLHDSRILQKKQRLNQVIQTFTHEENRAPGNGELTPEVESRNISELLTVPSFSTLQSLRRSIAENGNICPLTQKYLVQLDWVSKEDGSHILTVAVGSKIFLYAPRLTSHLTVRKESYISQPLYNDEVLWTKIRQVDLQTTDGLPPLPMQISWVRDGILIVGMDSEMHVYSQWKPKYIKNIFCENLLDKRNRHDEDILQKSTTAKLISINKSSTLYFPDISEETHKKSISDYGLFQASRMACPVVPQYHPKQLMELLHCGKIRWVKAILAHLVRYMCQLSSFGLTVDDVEDDGKQHVQEKLVLDNTEISSIPPLALWVLLITDKEVPAQLSLSEDDMKGYEELFNTHTTEDKLDLLGSEFEKHRSDRRQSLSDRANLLHFSSCQSQILSRLLTHIHLPGLSSVDQMHLLALADTVANCEKNFSEEFTNDSSKNINKEILGNISTDSLDDCGLRYLFAMKHFTYLLRCLPLNQRTQFRKRGLATSNIVWAFHSESEEELLHFIPAYVKGDLKWLTLKELGVGYWLKNITLLTQCVEKLAKSAYQLQQDPLDAAIYYLALKKKAVIWGLYKSKRDEKMSAFFSNNFSEDRWRRAALKNAFALLGKQRFEHAVAFFLLANSLDDAIEVCINKLDDFQLALIISRLYEKEMDTNSPPTYRKLLFEHIIGCKLDSACFEKGKGHPDPFLRSIAFWILKRYSDSLDTLLENDVGRKHRACEDILKNEITEIYPNVFNFYIYLRTHPLLIRKNIAKSAQEKKVPQIVLSGFSFSGHPSSAISNDKQLQIDDAITPVERQLYFATAHNHFKTGSPILALEVLNKLPTKVLDPNFKPGGEQEENIKKELLDEKNLDWINIKKEATGYEEKQELKEDNINIKYENNEGYINIDIMSQQLKFIACLKILMEELSTLATGFEVDGGQLRSHLYIWLEKGAEALKQLCSYNNLDKNSLKEMQRGELVKEMENCVSTTSLKNKSNLHGILKDKKCEFKGKVQRAARRKIWLTANEAFLRTLLSFCSLYGASGGGLASVRMELILLLQELQQEKTQQQLLSPLPFPTTLPLLSASIVGNKTVIADPITFLQCQMQDMLQFILEVSPLPETKQQANKFREIYLLRDLSISLSSCIYQSLCDSEGFSVNKLKSFDYQSPGYQGIKDTHMIYPLFECSYLTRNISQRSTENSMDEAETVWALPSKWPGVTNLRALLAHEKDEDIPKLNVLLLESFVAIYMSLFVYGLIMCDSRTLYRIIVHKFSNVSWSKIFGGGVKKAEKKVEPVVSQSGQSQASEEAENNSAWSTVTSVTKQRVKLNMKLLGRNNNACMSTTRKEEKPDYKEYFVQPEMSILTYLLTKSECIGTEYDTDEEFESDIDEKISEDSCDNSNMCVLDKCDVENTEHSNPMSRSWTILRLALIKLASKRLRDFIDTAGVDIQDLPVFSPLVHGILYKLCEWQDVVLKDIIGKGPCPPHYIPGLFVNSGIEGPTTATYMQFVEGKNTPFIRAACSGPIRRLWNFLVREEYVQDVFTRFILCNKSYYKKIDDPQISTETDVMKEIEGAFQNDAMRIIHKDHETILSFCVNNASSGQIAISNPTEIQELDISLLLESPNWYEDEYEMLNLAKDAETASNTGFLVIHTQDKFATVPVACPAEPTINLQSFPGCQSGRGTSLVLKRKVDNVKRMSAHPLMPLYLTGGQDGSVQVWEWGHQQAVCTPRSSGTFAKVTRCRFSEQGNKFGVADGDGNLSLWQAGVAAQNSRPFFTHQCHNKITSDFTFLGSCSLIATGGLSSDNKNIGLWDTLLPMKKSCVSSFICHDQGSSCVTFASQHQLLISCGKRGDICVFDLRQRELRNRYQAHDSSIKCIALDPNEEFFLTGSTEGDIKIWSLNNFSLLDVFSGEHAKNSFFKHIGQGVNQLYLDAFRRLYSCGSDGCMKVRQLVGKETIVNSMY